MAEGRLCGLRSRRAREKEDCSRRHGGPYIVEDMAPWRPDRRECGAIVRPDWAAGITSAATTDADGPLDRGLNSSHGEKIFKRTSRAMEAGPGGPRRSARGSRAGWRGGPQRHVGADPGQPRAGRPNGKMPKAVTDEPSARLAVVDWPRAIRHTAGSLGRGIKETPARPAQIQYVSRSPFHVPQAG